MGQASSPVARLCRGWFYAGAAALFLIPILLGFQQYIFAGKHVGGSPIDAHMVATRSSSFGVAVFDWPGPQFLLIMLTEILIFGSHTWTALFGPVVALGPLLLLVRSLITRRLDREFVFGYAALALVSVVAARMAATDTWVNWAGIRFSIV